MSYEQSWHQCPTVAVLIVIMIISIPAPESDMSGNERSHERNVVVSLAVVSLDKMETVHTLSSFLQPRPRGAFPWLWGWGGKRPLHRPADPLF